MKILNSKVRQSYVFIPRMILSKNGIEIYPDASLLKRITNNQGIANIGNLTPGPFHVTIETLGDPVEGDFVAYEAETAELTLVIPIDDLVDNSGVLAGIVRFEDGTPAERTMVRAELQDDVRRC